MNFKQMILVDYLLNNILKDLDSPGYQLVFELDSKIYTGEFSPKNDAGHPIVFYYEPGWAFEQKHWTFDEDKPLELRSAFFEYVFGKDSSIEKEVWEQYTVDLQHLVLNDVIRVISEINVDHYFVDDVEFPEIIVNLVNMETGQLFDHYVVMGKEFNPVSFIELPTDSI